MKMTVRILIFCVLLAVANSNEREQVKKYKLDVPGKQPITIIEKAEFPKWKGTEDGNQETELKNLMTHIVHDVNGSPRCYGPSCQQGLTIDEGPQDRYVDFSVETDKLKGLLPQTSFSQDRLQAITALAAKLKKDKIKADRYSSIETDNYQPIDKDRYQPVDSDRYQSVDSNRYQSADSNRYHSMESSDDDDDNGKVYTTWNRLKVKQHKHPFDDKDGWVTLEPVAWSTSKISKWKPNVKKQKPNHWHDDEDRFPDNNEDRFTTYQEPENTYNYPPKKPVLIRPGFVNNILHTKPDYEDEIPSKPTWTKPIQTYTSAWTSDEGRRPHKPNCDSDDHNNNDDTVFYGISDSVVKDHRPPNFPYEYEALHQAVQKRPLRRPTQVVYSGSPDTDNDRGSRPPYGDGQWVLLSTTKGYKNKKRQRSINMPSDDQMNGFGSVTSHQAVSLTVLPVDKHHTNMTTSHGGLLEVEKSFQTVEESKRAMDKRHDLDVSASQFKPVKTKFIKRKISSSVSPDSSTILAAVGAGMVPATMAMVVPMMLGRRKRDVSQESLNLDNIYFRQQ